MSFSSDSLVVLLLCIRSAYWFVALPAWFACLLCLPALPACLSVLVGYGCAG